LNKASLKKLLKQNLSSYSAVASKCKNYIQNRMKYFNIWYILIYYLLWFLIHSGKISALPSWKWTFGERKAVVVRIHMLQKLNAQTFLRKAKFHTEKEAKWTSKPQKSKVFRPPFLISQQKRLFRSKIFHGNESRKILLWRLFRLFFGMKFYMPNMWTY
jgi:hypothetical protein